MNNHKKLAQRNFDFDWGYFQHRHPGPNQLGAPAGAKSFLRGAQIF